MSVVEEIRQEQRKALSTMSTKEKWAYFWDYYKIHTLAAVASVFLIATFIYQYATNKDYAFYVTMINAGVTQSNSELSTAMGEEFMEYAQIDPNEYAAYIDTSVTLSEDMMSQATIASQEKMIAMMQVGTISAIVADTETFEGYAQFEYFYGLEDIFSEEQLEKYRPYLYYTDAATIGQEDDGNPYGSSGHKDPSAFVIDHRDPSSMEKPVAVGIILSEDNRIADAGYYTYLQNAEYDYQGHASDAVLGIPVTNKEPELVLRFLEYLNMGK